MLVRQKRTSPIISYLYPLTIRRAAFTLLAKSLTAAHDDFQAPMILVNFRRLRHDTTVCRNQKGLHVEGGDEQITCKDDFGVADVVMNFGVHEKAWLRLHCHHSHQKHLIN